MTENAPQKAVIYCRVSSKKQNKDGSGLASQEHRCREHARLRGYDVMAVFPDDVSGGGDFLNRPGMVALLSFLDAQPQESFVVIFDDLKRYARDVEFHLKLRREMSARGATRECLKFNFEDSPEGKFVETIMAAQGELEREQNGRQVLQKMKARIEQGFWVFRAPVGYKYVKSPRGGKDLVPDEPLASIVTEGLKGFASGRFSSQSELMRFFESQPEFPKDLPDGRIRMFTITRLLNKAVYAGYVEAPKWQISRRKGNHAGLISFATFDKIQKRLHETAYAPARKDITEDFQVRGFVACKECGHPYTAGWSKSVTGRKYAYYRCGYRPCESYGKSIKRDELEADVANLVRDLQPTKSAARLAKAMFEFAWDMRQGRTNEIKTEIKRQIADLDSKITKLVDRVVDSDVPRIVEAYEKRITDMEKNKLILAEKLENGVGPKHTFEQMFELAMTFLSSPWKIWENGDHLLRRMVLKLAFPTPIQHCRETGCLNYENAFVFNALRGISPDGKGMVLLERIELSTSPLPRECSTSELQQRRTLGQRGG